MSSHSSGAPTAGEPEGNIPISPALKQGIKDAIVAVTMGVWILVRPWSHLLIDQDRYFFKDPVTSVELGAMLLNMAWVSLAVWLGIKAWRRAQSKILLLVLDLVFVGLLIFPADYIRVQVFTMHFGGVGGFFKNPLTLGVLIVAAVLVLWKHRQAARGAALLAGLTLPVAGWTALKIMLVCLGVMHLRQCTSVPEAPGILPARAGQPRVLWIIFDETDFRLAYEKRPGWVKLPAFDQLRRESLFASHAYSPGSSTIISMPALIIGHQLAAVEHSGCDMALTRLDNGLTSNWSEMPNVFSSARGLGFNTALVGWYHPYSRVLGGSLNYCSWYPMPGFEMARAANFRDAIKEQLASLSGHYDVRRMFINACQKSFADGLSIVTNDEYGLILLHMPPPHLPGIYLAADGKFTAKGVEGPAGYFNNLMLADHELGAFRRAMESRGEWEKTWIIVSSDHWWRKSETYDNISDHRVPFIVRAPGPGHPSTYSHQFNTVLTHDLILAILRGQVTNQAGVAALLDTGAPDLPVIREGEGAE